MNRLKIDSVSNLNYIEVSNESDSDGNYDNSKEQADSLNDMLPVDANGNLIDND